jgi:transposase InsO family protein
MMGAEPGRPNELSSITRLDMAGCDPFKARPTAASSSPAGRGRTSESFGSRVRDEVLAVEAFDAVLEARTVITDWRTIDNHQRPHSGLGSRLPVAYAASLARNKSEKPARLS